MMLTRNESIEKAAKLLKVAPETVAVLPEANITAIASAFENIDINSDEDSKALYDAIDAEWQKGSVLIMLKEISESSGIAYKTLCSLDIEAQKEVAYEFLEDDSNMERIFSIVSKALNTLELDYVSGLTGIPLTEFDSISEEKRDKLCGHYFMCYEPGTPNTELAAELRDMFYSEQE